MQLAREVSWHARCRLDPGRPWLRRNGVCVQRKTIATLARNLERAGVFARLPLELQRGKIALSRQGALRCADVTDKTNRAVELGSIIMLIVLDCRAGGGLLGRRYAYRVIANRKRFCARSEGIIRVHFEFFWLERPRGDCLRQEVEGEEGRKEK